MCVIMQESGESREHGEDISCNFGLVAGWRWEWLSAKGVLWSQKEHAEQNGVMGL